MPGTNRVGPDTLEGITFDQGYMLEGRGMKDDVGTKGGETGLNAYRLTHVGDARDALERRPVLRYFRVDRIEVELGRIDKANRGGPDSADLPRDFRSDRAASPGDEHAPAGDQRLHRRRVEQDLLVTEKVLHRDRFEFRFVMHARL